MAGEDLPGHDGPVEVVVVGSANIDLIVRVPHPPRPGETVIADHYEEQPGGKGLNQAVAAAKHARTAFVACFGDDRYGRRLREHALSRGVKVAALTRSDAATGRALITLLPDGENSIVVAPLANLTLTAQETREALNDIGAAIALVQFEVRPEVVDAVVAWCAASGARLVINPSPIRAMLPELLERADPLLVNVGEASAILGFTAEPAELARALSARCASVVVTAGADGAFAATRGVVTAAPAPRVQVHDSSGAGDAFAGMLCARLAQGKDLDSAMREAVAEAARTVATPRADR